MKKLYLVMSCIGLLVSYYIVYLFFRSTGGFNPSVFIIQVFTNYPSSLAMIDLILSSVIFWMFAYRENKKYKIGKIWLFVLANFLGGLCFALPLFLYFREQKKE